MKRLFTFLSVFALLICIVPTAATASETNVTVTYLEDGSYIVTEISEITKTNARIQTKVGTKDQRCYDANDVLLWKISVTGEFLYDGTTCTCTYASGITTMYDARTWFKVSDSTAYSNNTATYTVVFDRRNLGVTIGQSTQSVTLTCDENGNLS